MSYRNINIYIKKLYMYIYNIYIQNLLYLQTFPESIHLNILSLKITQIGLFSVRECPDVH